MRFTNALIFTPDGFRPGGFEVEDGYFTKLLPETVAPRGGVDLRASLVIPGLVDLHTHGNSGADFSDGDAAGLRKMAAYCARQGVTSFAPTSMTLPYATLDAAFRTARTLRRDRPADCARVMGIHMEGPFFSEAKKGAQNAAYLKPPDSAAFDHLDEGCGGLIRIVDLAPELPGAAAFTAQASRRRVVSVAHTGADYEAAKAVFDAGARHLTHLFNAMPPLHHRQPGVIGAAAEREDVTAELICDGWHVHPSAVRLAFRLFPGRICLISDALRCCGMPDGPYELGGQTVFLRDGVARLADGTIAGSAANLWDCMRNAVAFGIPMEAAIRAATSVPARVLGCETRIGAIRAGAYADFIVCDALLNRKRVYLHGMPLDRKGEGT